jgi:hypothetical protein
VKNKLEFVPSSWNLVLGSLCKENDYFFLNLILAILKVSLGLDSRALA